MLGPAAVIAAALAAGVAPPVSHAQPAPEIERAKDLYLSAEAAMKDGRFDDAARDYGAAYELSRDPALFFKIGHAHERAGKCEAALAYYARYLREGKPTEQFAALTRERIAACGGAGEPPANPVGGTASGPGSGSAAGTPGAGNAGAPAGDAAGSAAANQGSAAGSEAAGSAAPAAIPIPSTQHKVAWILSGSAIALVALGGVLAYAARSSENDVRDLYAGFAGQPPAFDGATRTRYGELIDQGERYQHLSWAAFGLAGAAGIGAALLFTIGGERAEHARVTPVAAPHGAGVSVRF